MKLPNGHHSFFNQLWWRKPECFGQIFQVAGRLLTESFCIRQAVDLPK